MPDFEANGAQSPAPVQEEAPTEQPLDSQSEKAPMSFAERMAARGESVGVQKAEKLGSKLEAGRSKWQEITAGCKEKFGKVWDRAKSFGSDVSQTARRAGMITMGIFTRETANEVQHAVASKAHETMVSAQNKGIEIGNQVAETASLWRGKFDQTLAGGQALLANRELAGKLDKLGRLQNRQKDLAKIEEAFLGQQQMELAAFIEKQAAARNAFMENLTDQRGDLGEEIARLDEASLAVGRRISELLAKAGISGQGFPEAAAA